MRFITALVCTLPLLISSSVAAQQREPEPFLLFFTPGTSQIDSSAIPIVVNVAEYAKSIPNAKLVIFGNTDHSVSEGQAYGLTRSMAESVATALQVQGIDRKNMTVVAKGQTQPIIAEARGGVDPQNRYVRILVVKPGDALHPSWLAEAPKASTEPTYTEVYSANNERRVALVVGNSAYGSSLGSLSNPVNDAEMIAAGLRQVGFDVEVVKDADQKRMKRAIARLGERLIAAGPGVTGLFYYAGHGIQSRGTNYLIPTSAQIEREADVDLESVSADSVLLQMEDAGAATNIVIMDACRNMPVARSFRSGDRGLARMEAPNGSFIAYSTAPGSVAADGDGKNSPFALALMEQMKRKRVPIEVMFRSIRKAVIDRTGGKQTPWDSSSLIEPFVFASH